MRTLPNRYRYGSTLRLLVLACSGHKAGVRSLVFSPNGEWIASAGNDQAIRLWKATTGEPVREILGHEGQVESVRFSPDGKWIALYRFDGITILDASTGKEALRIPVGVRSFRLGNRRTPARIAGRA